MAYGVDLSGGEPILVRGVRSRCGAACSRLAADDPGFQADAAGGTVVAGCMLERESLTRWLQAPFASRSKARRTFPSLLDVNLPFPLDECVYRFIEAPGGRGGNARALAVAARQADVERRLAALKAAGVEPMVLDQEGLALWAYSLVELPDKALGPGGNAGAKPVRVVVYAGSDRVTLALGSGGRFTAAHSMRQPRADEVVRFLRGHFDAPPPALHWLWAGPAARDALAAQEMHREFSAKWPGPLHVVREPETFLARALAARAIAPDAFACNLRIGSLTHPMVVRRARRSELTTAAMLAAAGLVLCGIGGAWRWAAHRDEIRAQAAIVRLAAEISGLQKPPRGQEVLVAQRALDRNEQALAPFIRAFQPSLTVPLADLLLFAKQNNIAYDTLALRDKSVAIEGAADDWNQCGALSAHLAKLGFRVRLDRRGALAEDKVRFSIVPLDPAPAGAARGAAPVPAQKPPAP